MADFKAECVGRMDEFQASLSKVEQHVTILRSQWATSRTELERLSKQLVPFQALANDIAGRLVEVEQREESMRHELRRLRDDVQGLELAQQNAPGEDGADGEYRVLH